MRTTACALEVSRTIDRSAKRWYLSSTELGRVMTADEVADHRDGWTTGDVRPLVDGAAYFARLLEGLSALRAGDEIYFTGWRSDADELLTTEGPTLVEVLCDLVDRGVVVRGLVWRSHSAWLRLNAQANEGLARRVNAAGGVVLLDQRIPWFGSHHQKLFVIRRRGEPGQDVAFVGGVDVGHGRRDDSRHHGDPQQEPMDARYAGRAPWHDLVLELHGPIVDQLLRSFIERWNDPSPLDGYTPGRVFRRRLAQLPRRAEPISRSGPARSGPGAHAVQMLRTYGHRRPAYPFAPEGEQSVARACRKAFSRARSLILHRGPVPLVA